MSPGLTELERLRAENARLREELAAARRYEERLQLLADTSFEPMAIFDESHRCIDVNDAMLRIFGYRRDEVLGRTGSEFTAPESRELVRAHAQQAYSAPYEAVMMRKDGSRFPALLQGTNLQYQGQRIRVTTCRDISPIKEMQRKLEVAYSELHTIFENTMVGIVYSGRERMVRRANRRFAEMFGYEVPEAVVGRSMRDFHLGEERFRSFGKQAFAALAEGRLLQLDYQLRHRDGTALWVCISGKPVDPASPPDLDRGVIWIVEDISRRKETERRLQELASTDPLTGVNNRRRFLELAGLMAARARRFGTGMAVLVMDLDHFKSINDRLGHEAGDQALEAFADVCTRSLRADDVLGRMGGEEFAAVLPAADVQEAQAVADRIRENLAARTVAGGEAWQPMTVSIGVAAARGRPQVKDLLRSADANLYRAKAAGRNKVVAG